MNTREAEVLEMPKGDAGVATGRRIAQGRATVERYVERLKNATQRLDGPEAAELYCALAQLREGMIENDGTRAAGDYQKALAAFPHSHIANLGLRQLHRARHEYGEILSSLECELKTVADAKRRMTLELELARTYLYCANDAEKTIAILETHRQDTDAEQVEGGVQEAFDAQHFLLWEDALLATGAWDRYEIKLREALGLQKDADPMTQHLEERLWMLYRYIMPDEAQTQILCEHLMRLQPLDDELVDDVLMRAMRTDDHDGAVAILQNALERLEGSPREYFYRSLLSDIATFEFEDPDHGAEILADESVREASDLLLLHQQILLLNDGAHAKDLLNVYARSLELLPTPQLKATVLYLIACVMRDELENEEAAFDVLGEANETCPTHQPTIEALAKIHKENNEWERLAQLYELELSYAQDHHLPEYTPQVLIERHSRLAHLYERLQFALNAFNHYQAILKIRPDDIAALKGASRMAQMVGNWTELLQLYAAAEGCTQDTREHCYLLERIAQIAESYLNDADTACTALEALRTIEPEYGNTLSALARLYIKLGKWDALIALTDAEIETATNPEYRATLYCRNAEVSETALSNHAQAVLYYEKARLTLNTCREACEGLERLYEAQKAWEKLADLHKSEAGLTTDPVLKCEHLRQMARILDEALDSEDEAILVYETCLKISPLDEASRQYLAAHYQKLGQYEDLLRILEIELKAGGTLGAPWLTFFWMGRIEFYQLHNETRALASFEKAFLENPNHITLLRTWLGISRRIEEIPRTLEVLEKALERVTNEDARIDIELAIADLTLTQSHQPTSLERFVNVENADVMARYRGRGARFMTTVLVATDSASGRWESRLALALQPRQPREIQKHALLAAVVLNLPDSIRQRAQDALCNLQDIDLARHLWAVLTPMQRPDFRKLPETILKSEGREAQDLRRWYVISRLLAGDVEDPADTLLPEYQDEGLSYRQDLELLAAYYEKFENWNKLLDVLSVEQDNTRNESELIQLTLQRAWVLSKIRKPEEALQCVRDACQNCSFGNDIRIALYDYLEKQHDWDFLAEQIRLHLMHCDDPEQRCALWLRLADIYQNGMNNLPETLKCLDSAYHDAPTRGDILCKISTTAEKIGEIDIARRALDDYIQYHKPSLEEQLELEPRLLQLHFQYPGGDTSRMIAYFTKLSQETIQSEACKTILAKAHAIAGDPVAAAQMILAIVTYHEDEMPPFEDGQIELWLMLADLYLDKLHSPDRGEALLWELFVAFPKIDYVFERLNQFYTTPAERRIFVDNIINKVKESQAIQSDSTLVRKYVGFAAKVLGSELGAWKEAQALYSQAIDASVEPDCELVKDRAYARCRIPGEAKCAYEEFCALLVQNPFQTDIYRAAFDICKRNHANDRERVLKQLAQVFIPNAGLDLSMNNVRPKLMDARVLSDEMLLKHLSHPALRPVQKILHEAAPLIGRVLRDDMPRRTNLGGEKVRDPEVAALFSTCANAFGVTSIKGFYGHDSSITPTVLDDPPSYWIGRESWENLSVDAQRHWAGYVGGMLWTGVSNLIHSNPIRIWQLLDGIYYLVTKRTIGERDAYTVEASELVNTVFDRNTRKTVAACIDELGVSEMPKSNAPKWIEGILATADRAGLMFSGSLTASLPAILEAEGWNPTKNTPEYLEARYKHSPRLPQLVAFALSDDYLQLRYHAGLSLKPVPISG